jgi:hypothetical protein
METLYALTIFTLLALLAVIITLTAWGLARVIERRG